MTSELSKHTQKYNKPQLYQNRSVLQIKTLLTIFEELSLVMLMYIKENNGRYQWSYKTSDCQIKYTHIQLLSNWVAYITVPAIHNKVAIIPYIMAKDLSVLFCQPQLSGHVSCSQYSVTYTSCKGHLAL